MSFIAGLASALGSAVGSAGGGLMQQHIQNFFDRHMMNHQYHLNLDAWNKENAYNTPSMQMARYAEAGLNPNLIYGQANTGGHISTASATAKQWNPLIGLEYSALKADNANKVQQNSLLASQANYVDEQTKGVALENMLKGLTIGSLTGKDPFHSNPNDPYWWRDAKKFMRLVYDKTFTNYPRKTAVPNQYEQAAQFIEEFLSPSAKFGKGRNRLYSVDERGGKHYL